MVFVGFILSELKREKGKHQRHTVASCLRLRELMVAYLVALGTIPGAKVT